MMKVDVKVINQFMSQFGKSEQELVKCGIKLAEQECKNFSEELELLQVFKRICNSAGVDFYIPKLETIFESEILLAFKDGCDKLSPRCVDGYLFDRTETTFSLSELEKVARNKMLMMKQFIKPDLQRLTLYINPRTSVDHTIAVVNAAKEIGLSVTLMHYDKYNERWNEQEVK